MFESKDNIYKEQEAMPTKLQPATNQFPWGINSITTHLSKKIRNMQPHIAVNLVRKVSIIVILDNHYFASKVARFIASPA